MRRTVLLICVLLAVCALAAACSKQDLTGGTPSSSAASETEQPESGQSSESASPFRPGVWMAKGNPGKYYFFDAEGSFGRTASYENGTGVSFTYELQDGSADFHMGAVDVSMPCQVIVTDDDHISLEWEDGYAEALTFYSPLDFWHFHFYTDEELCQMALAHYAARNAAGGSELTAAAEDNGDGTVTIQVYQNLSDRNSTAAWYRIDRCTGEGQDVNSGDPIDLTNGTPDVAISYAEEGWEAAMEPDSFFECVADESAYRSDVVLRAEVPVSDFEVVSLEYTEGEGDPTGFRIAQTLFSTELLEPEKPLVVRMELPETIPNIGIAYVDRNGAHKLYAVSMSGLDGAPLLTEADQ